MLRILLGLSVLLLCLNVNLTYADDDDNDERDSQRVINSVQVSGTSIYIYGEKLIKNLRDKVFFAAEASSEMMEVPFTASGDDYIEVMLPYEPSAGIYRLGIGRSEERLKLSELISFGNGGAVGRDGVDGLDGATGPAGPQGEQGPIGLTGPQGDQGPIGLTGPQGEQGPIGLTGPQGEQGPIGLTGPQGEQGPIGLTGPQGERGPIGLTGPQGEQGPIGPAGPQGEQGPIGLTGPQGPIGLTGPAGPQGPAGVDGLDGSSCSAQQDGNTVIVSCGDGSQGVLAGAGTTVVLLEAARGEVNREVYATGDVVLQDALGTVLGKVVQVSAGFGAATIEVSVGTNNYFLDLYNDEDNLAVQGTGPAAFEVRYLTEDCSGLAFFSGGGYVIKLDGKYYIAANDPETLLFKSYREIEHYAKFSDAGLVPQTNCIAQTNVSNWARLDEISLPSEIVNAQYPLVVNQLP